MGTKRLIVATLVIIVAIGFIIVFLFQIGADERVIEAMLPSIEEQLDIRIHYDEIDTSLTSVAVKKVTIKTGSKDALLATIDRLAVTFRIGPLFWGDLDITGIRIDNLHVQSGKMRGLAEPSDWISILQKLKTNKPVDPPNNKNVRRPEITIVSGKIDFIDDHLALSIQGLKGKIGPKMESLIEIESYDLKHDNRSLLHGTTADLRYLAKEKRFSIKVENPAFELPADKATLLSIVRDGTASLTQFSEGNDKAIDASHLPRKNETAEKHQPVSHRRWDGLIVGGEGVIVDSANPANRYSITDITVKVSSTDDGSIAVRASGRSPDATSPITVDAQLPASANPKILVAFPGLSLTELGKILFPSEHITWNESSISGKLAIGIADQGKSIALSGQATLSNVSFQDEQLVTEPVVGFSVNTDFKMAYDRPEAVWHVEKFHLSRGMTKVTIAGDLWPDRLAFDLTLHMPPTACNQVKAAIPEVLQPKMKGVKLTGQIVLDLHLALDEQTPEEVVLEATLDNRCRIAKFGTVPKPDFFRAPFAYPAYTEKGEVIRLITGPGTDRWTPLQQISPYVIEALLTTEDSKFWRHKGVTLPEMRRAISLNLKKKALRHGASTVTMQLAKNLFLTRERSIARKLQELFFVWYLESNFSKDEILELYLNIVEFGPSIYGITDATMYYFGREPPELNQIESVYLIKLLPNPIKRHDESYAKNKVAKHKMDNYHRVLRVMNKRKRITDFELTEGLQQELEFHIGDAPLPMPRPPVRRFAVDDDTELDDYDYEHDADSDKSFW